MSDAIERALQRVESLRVAILESVERERGYYAAERRVEKADAIARAYDDVIKILREERRRS